jgi:uncharacterized membrane protein YdjX (TVP38/TMEM64 family)
MMERPVGEPSRNSDNQAPPDRRMAWVRLLTLGLVVAIMATIFLLRDHIQELAHFGYLGVFLVALIANATVFVPVPGVAMVFTMGAVFNPLLVAVFAGVGAALGELTGYLLGFSGQGLVEHAGWYQRIQSWMMEHPRWIGLGIMVMSAIPNPFFDATGIAAGTMKIPVWYFLIFCTIGSTLKMLLFAFGGNTILNRIFPIQ